MVFSDPLGFRCRICKKLRTELELGHIKKAGASERKEGDSLPHTADVYDEASNIELIAYCLDDVACRQGAIDLAGDLIVK